MFRRIVDEVRKWLPWTPTMDVVLLGVDYDTADEAVRARFTEDFCSRIQLTYRSGISVPLKVGDREIDSDAGWGCMLRVMQMTLAQCFADFLLGRQWRYEADRDLAAGSSYLEIVSCFLDTPRAVFSLHRLVDAGQRLFGKEPSTWFGPTSAAQALECLFKEARGDDGAPRFLPRFACVVFKDGPIFKADVLKRFEEGAQAVIFLVCRRLGLQTFNEGEYREGIERCFRLPEFMGLASGNDTSSAHFFVGTHSDQLLFLDPHTTQPALESIEAVCDQSRDAGLRPTRPLPMHWSRLNPSVCFGFMVRSPEAFLALCAVLSEGRCGDVFEVLEKEPTYDTRLEETIDDDFALLG